MTFEKRLRAAKSSLRALALYVCGDPSDADDLVRETLEYARECRIAYEPSRPFGDWLRECMEHVLVAKTAAGLDDEPVLFCELELGTLGDSPASDPEIMRERERVLDRIRSLSDDERDMLILLLSGDSFQRVSSMQSISRDVLDCRLGHALETLGCGFRAGELRMN